MCVFIRLNKIMSMENFLHHRGAHTHGCWSVARLTLLPRATFCLSHKMRCSNFINEQTLANFILSAFFPFYCCCGSWGPRKNSGFSNPITTNIRKWFCVAGVPLLTAYQASFLSFAMTQPNMIAWGFSHAQNMYTTTIRCLTFRISHAMIRRFWYRLPP